MKMKIFHFVTSLLVLMIHLIGKRKSKVEFPSTNEVLERMSRHRPTPLKGKAPISSSEPIALDDEHWATPLPVACTSTPRPPKHKKEDEEWHFTLMVLQGLSVKENHHAAYQIGEVLMIETDPHRLLSRSFVVLYQGYYCKPIQVKHQLKNYLLVWSFCHHSEVIA